MLHAKKRAEWRLDRQSLVRPATPASIEMARPEDQLLAAQLLAQALATPDPQARSNLLSQVRWDFCVRSS